MTAAVSGVGLGAAVGSIPFAWLLYRAATGRDLREVGSGNPGATNLERAAGWGWGAAALALDAGKGAAAVVVAQQVAGTAACVPAAVGAVLGHVFTPWLRGRGGKGVATTAGAFAVLAPAATAIAVALFVIVALLTRFVSAASVSAAVALPLAMLPFGPGGREAEAAAAVALLIAWRHRGNFARMREGTEPRLGGRASDRGSAAR
jgi:glycerol-3-phosphate acyltransferase PlsY